MEYVDGREMRRGLALTLCVVVLVGLDATTPQVQEDERAVWRTVEQLNRQAAEAHAAPAVPKLLAVEFKTALATVQEAATPLGGRYGDAAAILAIVRASGRTASEVILAFKRGLGWGDLARTYGVALREILAPLQRVLAQIPKGQAAPPRLPFTGPLPPGRQPPIGPRITPMNPADQ